MARPSRIAFAISDLVSEIKTIVTDAATRESFKVEVHLDWQTYEATIRELTHHFGAQLRTEQRKLGGEETQIAGIKLVGVPPGR